MNEENENASPWDSLVGELGVEVNPEALERKQPAPKPLPTVSQERGEVAPPPPAPSDWVGLASSLGLEVPPEEPPRKQEAVARKSAEPVRTEKPSDERARDERRRDDKPREGRQREERSRDDKSRDDKSRERGRRDDKPRGERKRGERKGDERKSERGRDRRSEKPAEIQADIEFEEVLEDDDDELISEGSGTELDVPDDAPQEPEKPRISGEAARSAFDALFSAEAVNWGSAFVSPRTNVESSFLFTEGEEAVFDEDIPDQTEVDEEDDEEAPKKRPRRRRRGGRGRGRGRKEDGTEELAGAEDVELEGEEPDEPLGEVAAGGEEAGDDEEQPEKRRRRRRGRGRVRRSDGGDAAAVDDSEEESRVRRRVAAHTGDDDDDDEADADDEGSSTEEGRAGHRNLPTWNDAIGVIVDGNLAQRSKAPAKQQNQARGRGRGGRRHKKS